MWFLSSVGALVAVLRMNIVHINADNKEHEKEGSSGFFIRHSADVGSPLAGNAKNRFCVKYPQNGSFVFLRILIIHNVSVCKVNVKSIKDFHCEIRFTHRQCTDDPSARTSAPTDYKNMTLYTAPESFLFGISWHAMWEVFTHCMMKFVETEFMLTLFFPPLSSFSSMNRLLCNSGARNVCDGKLLS